MTVIHKSRDFAASDLSEYILSGLPSEVAMSKVLLRALIQNWLRLNSVEKKPKKRVKKQGRRPQIEMDLEN